MIILSLHSSVPTAATHQLLPRSHIKDKGSTDVFMRDVVLHKAFTDQALNLSKLEDYCCLM